MPLKVVRNTDFQEITLCGDDGKVLISFALAYGFRNIQNIIRRIKQKRMPYHFVEIMACPSGCLNGGGQMKPEEGEAGGNGRDAAMANLEGLYHHSSIAERHPGENPGVISLMNQLGGHATEQAAQVFRTTFQDRTKKAEATAMSW